MMSRFKRKTKVHEYELPPRPELGEHPGDRMVGMQAEAFDPTVIIGPPNWEVYNCTTCEFGEPEHPKDKQNVNTFHVKCDCSHNWLSNRHWNDGPRYGDINCSYWRVNPTVKKERNIYARKI